MDDRSFLIAAFGNPLWDVCVSLPDNTVLTQFGLAEDSAKEATAPEYELLLRAVKGYSKEECLGGAALNTLRVFQWLIGRPYSSVFFGGVGNDHIGKQLVNHVHEAGVYGRFKIHENFFTGSAICLIHGNLRTLIAHLGAAEVYHPEDFTEEDRNIAANVKLVYIENFFFSHSDAVVWEVVKMCKINGVAIVFNLSGSYLFEKHAEAIVALAKCANVVIGNESEYLALAQSSSWTNIDIREVACRISNEGIQTPSPMSCIDVKARESNNFQDLGKVVVITRGHKPVLCARQGSPLFETPVLQPKSAIRDTTGAGDAFVAGFVFGIVNELPVQKCVQLGCYASTEIIQQIGCKPPDYSPLEIEEILKDFTK